MPKIAWHTPHVLLLLPLTCEVDLLVWCRWLLLLLLVLSAVVSLVCFGRDCAAVCVVIAAAAAAAAVCCVAGVTGSCGHAHVHRAVLQGQEREKKRKHISHTKK